MKKKPKKGQITLFLLLGLIVFFIFVGMVYFSQQIKISQLKQEKEKISQKILAKESLRVYIEDCLQDSLEKGLKLIGQQGRIWKNQGGIIPFSENQGRIISDEKNQKQIAYGLTFTQKNLQPYSPPNKYPCQEGEPPSFCKYSYPNSSSALNYRIKFGEWVLKEKTIEKDLEYFLINQSILCVEELVEKNLSATTKIATQEIDLDLKILDGGISVAVTYPVTLKWGNKEIFTLSEFSFFYVSFFGKLLDAIINYPLKYDWSFVNFTYNEESLKKNYFEHPLNKEGDKKKEPLTPTKYQSLAVKSFKKIELEKGDDLFIFIIPENKILEKGAANKNYSFQFIRQNRPPALDYISRCPAQEYDYLAIANLSGELGQINITPFALDPDEDKISYSFNVSNPSIENENKGSSSSTFFISKEELVSLSNDNFNITVSANDSHLSDWQNVRIKVEKKKEPQIKLYNLINEQNFVISLEDPACLEISNIEGINNFSLEFPNTNLNFKTAIRRSLPDPNQSNNEEPCKLENFQEKIGEINLTKYFPTPFLLLSGEVSYGKEEKCSYKTNATLSLTITQCIPYDNPDENIGPYIINPPSNYPQPPNPFLADHLCCLGNLSDTSTWRLAPSSHVCYENTSLGCYNQTFPSYLTQGFYYTCDGIRGNVCGSTGQKSSLINITSLEEYKKWVEENKEKLQTLDNFQRINFSTEKNLINFSKTSGLLCGFSNKNKCPKLQNKCQALPEFSYATGSFKYWCYTQKGNVCQFCGTVIVDTNKNGFGDSQDICGCNEETKKKPCLKLETGQTGFCGSNSCIIE